MALLLQVSALCAVLLLAYLTKIEISPLLLALGCGVIAAALSYFVGLASWWLPIQLLFVPALLWTLSFHLSPSGFLIAFLVLLVIYWSTFRSQVPLYLSSRKIWQALELLLPEARPNKTFTFMDLGSGLGGVLTHLAAKRTDGHYHGVEVAPLPFLLSWLRIRLGDYRNCQVRWDSLWSCDLGQYDVVFAYLSPVPMEKLWHKAKREMRPGTLFISNTFSVPDHPPQQTFRVDDVHHSTLYIWRMEY